MVCESYFNVTSNLLPLQLYHRTYVLLANLIPREAQINVSKIYIHCIYIYIFSTIIYSIIKTNLPRVWPVD